MKLCLPTVGEWDGEEGVHGETSDKKGGEGWVGGGRGWGSAGVPDSWQGRVRKGLKEDIQPSCVSGFRREEGDDCIGLPRKRSCVQCWSDPGACQVPRSLCFHLQQL